MKGILVNENSNLKLLGKNDFILVIPDLKVYFFVLYNPNKDFNFNILPFDYVFIEDFKVINSTWEIVREVDISNEDENKIINLIKFQTEKERLEKELNIVSSTHRLIWESVKDFLMPIISV